MNPPVLHIRTVGEQAICCAIDGPIQMDHQYRFWQLADVLARDSAIVDLMTGMNNLTVMFDPLEIDADRVALQVRTLWERPLRRQSKGRLISIPVVYDGPDLSEVAAHCRLSAEDVVDLHTRAEYTVYFLGFQPGFAYLGGLHQRLHTPRRAVPRTSVPAGSVGIGGGQTGIYPSVTPGGWQLIGRTSLTLFDPSAQCPTLMRPGDRIRFVREGRDD